MVLRQGTLEALVNSIVAGNFWRGKKVFVTGHTGFKGSWLALWLHHLGAEVSGYALAPPTEPNHFELAGLAGTIRSTIGDIRDYDRLNAAVLQAEPEIVFHLAAQPLVRESYLSPAETYAVNVMGTVNLLEAVRAAASVRAVVNVTTDKCYENREWPWGYRENERLGGHDPYSSSKACSELVTSAYRASFLGETGVGISTARAGNVIGGGDWASDRLLPDLLRSAETGQVLKIRLPNAVRPWQHVLEPLAGYLLLAQALFADPVRYSGAWNFGPDLDDTRDVAWVVDYLSRQLDGLLWEHDAGPHPHETRCLRLDISKARQHLDWSPRWSLSEALDMVIEWHESLRRGEVMREVSLMQIDRYQSAGLES